MSAGVLPAGRVGGLLPSLAAFLLLVALAAVARAPSVDLAATVPEQSASALQRKVPLAFVPNAGQTDSAVRYYARGPGYAFYFTRDKAVLDLHKGKRALALQLRFRGANPNARLEPLDRAPGTVNYIGKGRNATNIPTFARIAYRDLWPGIDMVFAGKRGKLEYEFLVRPGADPADIELAYAGARSLSLSKAGRLLIATSRGRLTDNRPDSYELVGGKRLALPSSYTLAGVTRYRFAVSGHDPRRPLVIDPGIAYSTYLGGSMADHARGVTVDRTGSAIVTGGTESLDYPTTTGAYDQTYNGGVSTTTCERESVACGDAFVTKLSPDGTTLVWSTYIGGSSGDIAWRAALGPFDDVFVVGRTESSDFPTTSGAYDTTFNGGVLDGFVTWLSANGTTLEYSTYLGGVLPDEARDITVDSNRNAYVTGRTASLDFPTTPGAYDPLFGGGEDGFITKINFSSTPLVYSTYYGGSGVENPFRIAIDAQRNAYVVGRTASADLPTTPGAYDILLNGSTDAFAAKLNPSGSGLVYSTYLGGTGPDTGTGLDVDSSGSAYVSGRADSTDFPTTPGAFDTTNAGNGDAFVTKLNPSGSALAYSTFLGGGGLDWGLGLAVDEAGDAIVAGETGSGDFPTTAGAADETYNGNDDVFLTKLSETGNALGYSTFVGGTSGDGANSVAIDPSGTTAYITGRTDSTDYPATAGVFQGSSNGGSESFVTKLTLPGSPSPYEFPASASPIGVSLVNVFRQCSTGSNPANGQHSPPLGTTACLPPSINSGNARLGDLSASSASLSVLPGDFGISATINDVRTPGNADYNPGTRDLEAIFRTRWTDRANCASAGCTGPYASAATTLDLDLGPTPIDCLPNGSSTAPPGSDCNVNTTANALVPGLVAAGKQTLVQVFRVRITDQTHTLMAQQGIYVP
jgi:hypothetical protein